MAHATESLLMEGGTPTRLPFPSGSLEACVVRVLAGDTEAFGPIVEALEPRLLGLAWRMIGDRDQARDAAQEAFLRIYRSLRSFRLDSSFTSWAYRITVNVCRDYLRKRGPTLPSGADPEALANSESHAEPADAAVLRQERRNIVQSALDTLTHAERSALVLRDLEGLSTEEAAAALGVRPVTVRSQVSSARAKIRAFCAQRIPDSTGVRP
jgi:RNA polymerase sigma-70 factor (ECF subfamily)